MTSTAAPLSSCCAVPVRTRPADPRSIVATSVTYCPSCALALTMTPHERPAAPPCHCDSVTGPHEVTRACY